MSGRPMEDRPMSNPTPSLLLTTLLSLAALGATPGPAPSPALLAEPRGPSCPSDPLSADAIQRTSDMVWDEDALRLAEEHGLDLVNLTWEDTGRHYGSGGGPKISPPDHPGQPPNRGA